MSAFSLARRAAATAAPAARRFASTSRPAASATVEPAATNATAAADNFAAPISAEVRRQLEHCETLVDRMPSALGHPTSFEQFQEELGNTPLIELDVSPNPLVKILGKAEYMNPGRSVKDRIVNHIFTQAEKSGDLRKGDTIVAASSGNTGCSVAMISQLRGYRCVIITNTKCSQEKVDALRAYDADVLVTASGVDPQSPEHYENLAAVMASENPGYFDVDQYDNKLNPDAHYRSLGPELWRQTEGKIDYFVAAGSTGGTVSGTGRFLKEQNPNIKVVLPDPYGSIFYEYWRNGVVTMPESFKVEGVGKDSIPKAMDFSVIDDVIRFEDKEAFAVCRQVAERNNILIGGSSGANVLGAIEIAKKLTEPATIVAVMPDSGVKYMSKVYNGEWLQANGCLDA